ncbi:MAG TPA: Maf family protein, partial [Alphaproteobacteria bacterium]|nr:Maf family protein [Alphaproteobacteria bacterium]
MTNDPSPTLILASSSTSRATLLREAGLDFAIQPARVDEEAIKQAMQGEGAKPRDIADALAELKSQRISSRQPHAMVIGADQILVCENRLFNKPGDMDEARAHLEFLSGKRHDLVSGTTIARAGSVIWRRIDIVKMTMRELSESFISGYLERAGEDVLGSVGCYRLEGLGVQLFRKIEGD